MVFSNPRALKGQSSWKIPSLAAYKAHGFSLPNLYSIYFPSGVPSVSSPLPLLNFLYSLSFTPTQISSVPVSPPSLSPLFSSPVPRCHLPTPTKPHTSAASPPVYVLSLFSSPHLVWSGSRRSVWSSERSCWTPAGQRFQPPHLEQLVCGTPPW